MQLTLLSAVKNSRNAGLVYPKRIVVLIIGLDLYKNEFDIRSTDSQLL